MGKWKATYEGKRLKPLTFLAYLIIVLCRFTHISICIKYKTNTSTFVCVCVSVSASASAFASFRNPSFIECEWLENTLKSFSTLKKCSATKKGEKQMANDDVTQISWIKGKCLLIDSDDIYLPACLFVCLYVCLYVCVCVCVRIVENNVVWQFHKNKISILWPKLNRFVRLTKSKNAPRM